MTERVTDLREVYHNISYKGLNLPWKHARQSSYDFTTDVDYQRDHVWTKEQREAYIGYVLEGGESPPLWANITDDGMGPTEIIDGKQRMTSAFMWLDGEICGRTLDGREVWYADLDAVSKRLLTLRAAFNIRIVELDRNGVLNLYLKLNSAGVKHTEEELNKVREMLEEENV